MRKGLIETPMPRERRRRIFGFWVLWGLLGTSLTFEGATNGTGLTVALWLGAPFWALFVLWPFLWLRDRLRARRLWAELLHEFRSEEGESGCGAALLRVVFGREGGAIIPAEEWRAAFPDALPDATVEELPAGALEGVGVSVYRADDLIAWGRRALKADGPARDFLERLEFLKRFH